MLTSILLALSPTLPALPPQAPVFELETLGAPGAEGNERLGDNVALDGAHLAAGLASRTTSLPQAGVVVVWPRVGAGFGAPVTLESPLPTSGGGFGTALALDGDELLVAERFSNLMGFPVRGVAHRFRFVGGAWTPVDSVPSPTGTSSDGFGWSCDKDGDLMVVGAPFESGLGMIHMGVAYVFQFTGGQWQLEAQLVASDGATSDQFGMTVALDGERIVVGAPMRVVAGVPTGAAYAYERVAGTWTETGRFTITPGTGDHMLGVSIAVSGTAIALGAARTNDPGATYLLRDVGATWASEARLQPTGLGDFATFGHSVALSGDDLVVGAYQDSAAGNLTGSAWVFRRSGGAWTPTVRLVNTESTPAFHGFSVALDGAGAFVVGEPIRSLPGAPGSSGVVHFYRPERPVGTAYCAAVANSTQRAGALAALGSDVALHDQVTLTAYYLPNNSFGFFLTSRTQGLVQQPGGSQGVLCLGGSIGRYVGQGQVRNTGSTSTFALVLALGVTPTPTGLVSIVGGETWNFQAWHRDSVGGQATSNFTGAVTVAFQ